MTSFAASNTDLVGTGIVSRLVFSFSFSTTFASRKGPLSAVWVGNWIKTTGHLGLIQCPTGVTKGREDLRIIGFLQESCQALLVPVIQLFHLRSIIVIIIILMLIWVRSFIIGLVVLKDECMACLSSTLFHVLVFGRQATTTPHLVKLLTWCPSACMIRPFLWHLPHHSGPCACTCSKGTTKNLTGDLFLSAPDSARVVSRRRSNCLNRGSYSDSSSPSLRKTSFFRKKSAKTSPRRSIFSLPCVPSRNVNRNFQPSCCLSSLCRCLWWNQKPRPTKLPASLGPSKARSSSFKLSARSSTLSLYSDHRLHSPFPWWELVIDSLFRVLHRCRTLRSHLRMPVIGLRYHADSPPVTERSQDHTGKGRQQTNSPGHPHEQARSFWTALLEFWPPQKGGRNPLDPYCHRVQTIISAMSKVFKLSYIYILGESLGV